MATPITDPQSHKNHEAPVACQDCRDQHQKPGQHLIKGHGSRPDRQRCGHHNQTGGIVQDHSFQGCKSEKACQEWQAELCPVQTNQSANNAHGSPGDHNPRPTVGM
jgi:hypothetical protein